ncbi:MAG: NUDIX domain-containing protein [Chloroflexi bacterium]|nr:NUDIX domain-containing protein [Chloroflexota bacterium]
MPKLPVKRAVSAGGVVYRREGKEIQVALVGRAAKDIWALPKGLVEEGEDVAATATREVADDWFSHATHPNPERVRTSQKRQGWRCAWWTNSARWTTGTWTRPPAAATTSSSTSSCLRPPAVT